MSQRTCYHSLDWQARCLPFRLLTLKVLLYSKFAMVPFDVVGRDRKNPYYLLLRPDLHEELRRVIRDAEAVGPVPEMVLGSKITGLDIEAGIVTTEDRTYTGDVIIGADGIHSLTRNYVQPDAKIKPWGKSCYRWLLPRASLLADLDTRALFQNDGYFGESTGVDRRIVWYPCQDNTVVNFAAFVPAQESNADGADFDQQGSKAALTRAFSAFDAGARRALEYAGDDLSVWDLYDMEEMPRGHNGKLVLMGDAVHPFLPFMGMLDVSQFNTRANASPGQGAAMAIEDAASLAALLPSGTSVEEIPERFRLYQQCRQERATFIQQASRLNGLDLNKRDPSPSLGKMGMAPGID